MRGADPSIHLVFATISKGRKGGKSMLRSSIVQDKGKRMIRVLTSPMDANRSGLPIEPRNTKTKRKRR